jgi:hypothetical protein
VADRAHAAVMSRKSNRAGCRMRMAASQESGKM